MGTFTKAVFLLLTVALLAMTATFGVANSQSANGDHDTDGDGLIEIQYLEQLDAIRYDLNGDGRADDDAGISPYAAAFPGTVCNSNCNGYELTRSLDFDDADSYASGTVNTAWTTGEGWEPIQAGELWGIVAEYLFDATFDGNEHTISNLYVSRPHSGEGAGPVGLFGSTSDSVIRNVGLIDVSTDGFTVVGGLVGINHGLVADSYVTGSASGVAALGGLVGWNVGEITDSRFSGAVTAHAGDLETHAVGGLVGLQDRGAIIAGYSSGSVSGHEYVGGLVGEVEGGYIVASSSSARVTGSEGVGGLAGVNRFLISGSYATGHVSGDTGVGGLVGYHSGVGMIVASYATGNVAGKEDAGGLAGGNGYLITASYATGHVSGDENVGGLVGRNLDAGNITASYATGHVSGGDNVGGLVGFNDASVRGGVWDAETSGNANGVGWGNSDGVTGMTSAELQAAAGYDGAFRDWSIHFVGDDRRYFRYLDDAPGPYDFWDFGASGQYPALSAYLNIDGITVWWEPGQQPTAARPPLLAPTPTRGIAQGRGSRHDADGNGLIEIRFLEQLDAVRHDLDGDGIPEDAAAAEYAAAYPGFGDAVVCGGGCQGYELARPLDFASADSYASGAVYAAWTRAAGWQPIGGEDALNGRYNAIFDGNGHAVANLYINRSRSPAVGLFGYAGYSSVIRNVGLTNVSIAGSKDVGALAGVNMGEIVESYAVGSASAHHQIPGDHAGGLVGNNLGVIWGSHAAVAMSCGEYGEYIGGLAGGNQRSIVDSYATGSVTCANGASLGGLTGANWGAVARSHASGDVTGGRSAGGLTGSQGYDGAIIASHATGNVTGGRDVGGLAGGSSGIIRWSFGTGSVDGDSNVGGLVGQNGGRIIASYASGRVVGAQAVGGLVGANNYGAIIASYATGAASGDMSVGGLAGESRHSDVVASYAIGAVAGTHDAGGLIGAGGLTVRETASFWDAQSTGQESSSNGTGKTTDELQGPTAYTGIFADWNVDLDNADGDDDPATGADDFWDFGTSTEYPILKFDLDGDGAATWQEFGNQTRTAIPAADNCLETVPNAGVVAGSWGSACLSFNRPGSYARYYVFTLDTDSEVFITLVSDDVDTYLYLQKGAGTQSDSFQSQGSSDPYSRIEDGFAAGTYTIEATTYEAGQAGSFTLTVHKPGADDDCVEIMTTVAITGTWSSDCASGRRPESYARFYTFTLTEPSVVIIDLETEGAGAYLYLLRGAGRAGEVLEDYGSRRGSAELGHTLDAGTYTVEVTTYDRAQTGDFTLTVLMAALPPPPPPDMPAPPPEPIPTATLPPAPTPVFVPPPTPAPAGPTSAVTPTATPIAAPEPTPATGSGGACSYPDGNVPPGAAAVSIFLLLAPTAVMSGLRLRARRRGGH